jgi:hypothetical protein
MRGDPVATILYERVIDAASSSGDDDVDDDDDNAIVDDADDEDADADADADTNGDEENDGGSGGGRPNEGMRKVAGCYGNVVYIAYHTRQHAASAAGVARVHATRNKFLDGCVIAYSNPAYSGPDSPVNYVRPPPPPLLSDICPSTPIIHSNASRSNFRPL